MMSPEYPDLAWMPPKSWRLANRPVVQVVVIHTTEGSARGTSAEDGAAYDQTRPDGTSTHFFHDNDSTVQCVQTKDIAYAARTQGNLRGIQHELCTRAGSANWADNYHQALLRRAARQVARDCRKWDIPVRKLSPVQVAGGWRGLCGHVDITNAFPDDGGTHTDPGTAFPWELFLNMVTAEIDGGDEMDVAEFFASVARAVKGGTDATAADRANRNNFAIGARFALGYNWNVQDGDDTVPDEKTVMGKLDEIIGKMDESA